MIEIIDSYHGQKIVVTLEKDSVHFPPFAVKVVRRDWYKTEAAAEAAFRKALPKAAQSYRQKNRLD